MQNGHFDRRFVRELTFALQMCHGFKLHRHQAWAFVPGTTSLASSSLFFVGCHSAAIAGCMTARLLNGPGMRVPQCGQALGDFRVRAAIGACHV